MKSNSFNFSSNIPQRINHHFKDRQFVKKNAISKRQISDSETDVSTTSNENLSQHEDRLVGESRTRQEESLPLQQAETPHSDDNLLFSNRSSFDESTSSYNTLIVCNPTSDDSLSNNNTTTNFYGRKTIVKRNSVNSPVATTAFFRTTKRNSLENRNDFEFSIDELNKIPNEYFSQSQILKHLANEACSSSPQSSPEFSKYDLNARDSGVSENLGADLDRFSNEIHAQKDPKWCEESAQAENRNDNDGNGSGSGSGDMDSDGNTNGLLRMQPDLCQVVSASDVASVKIDRLECLDMQAATSRNPEIVWQTNDMIDILIKENCALKAEIENCYHKIAKTQFLEREIEKIANSYEELVQSSERREKLEVTVRSRLHADCKRLQELNKDYKDQVELLSNQLIGTETPIHEFPTPEGLKNDLHKREMLISQLITQNKDLMSINERLEMASNSLKSTIQEQKSHIEILETTISSMRSKNAILENQCRKKNELADNVERLKQMIGELELGQKTAVYSTSSECSENGHYLYDSAISRSTFGFDSMQKQQLHNKDDMISFLKSECLKLEKNYFEDRLYKKESGSVKISSHESNLNEYSMENHQSSDDAFKNSNYNHFTSTHMINLQTRIKDLEEKLNERDSLISALQKHSYERNSESNSSSYQSLLNRNVQRSARSSICNSTFACSKSLSRDNLVKSAGAGESGSTSSQRLNSNARLPQSLPSPTPYQQSFNQKSYDETKRKLDAQLKVLNSKLDSQLVQKQIKTSEQMRSESQRQSDRRLCCFPRFTNASSAARKEKEQNQQAAAAAVVTNRNGGSVIAKTNDVELLEQQRQMQRRPRQFSQKLCKFGKKSAINEKSSLLQHDMMRGNSSGNAADARVGSGSGNGNDDSNSFRSESLPPSALPRPQSKASASRNFDPILDRKNSVRLKQPCLQPTQVRPPVELKKTTEDGVSSKGQQPHRSSNSDIRQTFGKPALSASRLAVFSAGSQAQSSSNAALLPNKKMGYFCRLSQQPVAAALQTAAKSNHFFKETKTSLTPPSTKYRIQF